MLGYKKFNLFYVAYRKWSFVIDNQLTSEWCTFVPIFVHKIYKSHPYIQYIFRKKMPVFLCKGRFAKIECVLGNNEFLPWYIVLSWKFCLHTVIGPGH